MNGFLIGAMCGLSFFAGVVMNPIFSGGDRHIRPGLLNRWEQETETLCLLIEPNKRPVVCDLDKLRAPLDAYNDD